MSVTNRYKYTFTPFLFQNNTFWDVSEEYREIVMDWYQTHLTWSAEDENIRVFNIFYEKDEISFEINKWIDSVILESLVDPDINGDYPIEINNIRYLVIGKNFYFNDKPTQ